VVSGDSQVTGNDNLLNPSQEALSLLGLQLENPGTFKVVTAERGARNDISSESLELWTDIHLTGTIRTKGLYPFTDKLFAAC
jgi:hypothetical protein